MSGKTPFETFEQKQAFRSLVVFIGAIGAHWAGWIICSTLGRCFF